MGEPFSLVENRVFARLSFSKFFMTENE